ncbi:MAG: hypothetical protein JWM05_2914 [Acidimicrobiales bacterium]|nr:hypothetical protein [Acidimicrobiales bacterium]
MRVRVRFAKTGKVRWTSHRDLARIWERAIRRVGLPVAYSAGYSPRPKLHFGLALSTGHESVAEFLDVDIATDPEATGAAIDLIGPFRGRSVDVDHLPELLTPTLPVGIEAVAAEVIPPGTPSLQEAVTSCTWRVEVRGVDERSARTAVDRGLAADQLILTRQRKGKDVTDDVRPYLLDLTVIGPTEHGTELEAHLATQPRGLRIAELLAVLGDGAWEEGRVRRTHQWTLHDGARQEPISAPAGATSAPHAEARAS